MVSLIDVALASQNMAIAAESLGLGICYIGGIRNNLVEVSQLLKTPDHVLPVFALVVGYPDQQTEKKPRAPFHHIYHENEYEQDLEQYKSGLQEYNEEITEYYEERTNGARSDTWTTQMAGNFAQKSRMYMKGFVQQKKFDLK